MFFHSIKEINSLRKEINKLLSKEMFFTQPKKYVQEKKWTGYQVKECQICT